MDLHNIILEDNEKKCAAFDHNKARRLLILYRELNSFIGDLCLRVDKIWRIKDYFPDAIIDFNFTFAKQQWIYDALLRNSPYINKLFAAELDQCDYGQYDLIIYVDGDETSLLDVLAKRYEKYGADNYAPPVFSMTTTVFRADRVDNIVFPLYEDLIASLWDTLGELHISDEEREWAHHWLEERGVNEDDAVVIVLDTSSVKSKLLNLPVYFDFVQFLLKGKNIKVLNFDEKGVGKEDFYKAWLGDNTENLIFSRNLSLRQVLSVLAAHHIKMIFGPCTGLMHCSSAIYNGYKRMGMAEQDIPIIITYTGQYPEEQTPAEWWDNAPLVDCIMLKARYDDQCSLVKLRDLPPEEQIMNDSLPVSRFTAEHLIDFVDASFQKRSLIFW